MAIKFWIKRSLFVAVVLGGIYGLGRVYYNVTGGFAESNIEHDLPYSRKWEVTELDPCKKELLDEILSQEFYYLGKGCQSYVFSSRDDKYVVKFFKYQRFRPQFWLEWASVLPFFKNYYNTKLQEKNQKLANAMGSWKLAYEDLESETGILYVHFNKKQEWDKDLVVYDKMGLKHSLNLNNLEFMVQKKGRLLCDVLLELKNSGEFDGAKKLVDKLLCVILSEYHRGYADNDQALMQNTGVFGDEPIHIDVGQFVKNSVVKEEKIYHQELFNRMWYFRRWLKKEFFELKSYLDVRLEEVIGSEFFSMKPILTRGGVGHIPFEDSKDDLEEKKL